MSKKYKYKNPIKENIGIVRDGFSRYLDASSEYPVIITDRGTPKSVMIDYDFYLDFILGKEPKPKSSKIEEKPKRKKYTKASDFRGIGNPTGKKIDIKKEIEDAWTKGY